MMPLVLLLAAVATPGPALGGHVSTGDPRNPALLPEPRSGAFVIEAPPTPWAWSCDVSPDWAQLNPPQEGAPLGERGRLLFEHVGCVSCHGLGGTGGVRPLNYVKDEIPRLDTIAEKLMLHEPADALAVARLLDAGTPLESAQLDVPRANAVVAQHRAVVNLVLGGVVGGARDPAGPAPPAMPAWKTWLEECDVDAILAWLLTLSPPEGAGR